MMGQKLEPIQEVPDTGVFVLENAVGQSHPIHHPPPVSERKTFLGTLLPIADHVALLYLTRFGVLDLIPVLGSVDVQTLITKSGAQPSTLMRMLKHVMMLGVCKEQEDGTFVHTSLSAYLVENESFGNLTRCLLRRHLQTVKHVTKTVYYDHAGALGLDDFESRVQRFRTSMDGVEGLMENYDWAKLGRGVVIQLAGGSGLVALELARRFRKLNFEVEDSYQSKDSPLWSSSHSRVRFKVHGVFEPHLSRRSCTYLLRGVLTLLSDDLALDALRKLVPAMREGTKVVINEIILADDDVGCEDKPTEKSDLFMVAVLNSEHRTLEEWRKLIFKADGRYVIRQCCRCPRSDLAIIELEWRIRPFSASRNTTRSPNARETALQTMRFLNILSAISVCLAMDHCPSNGSCRKTTSSLKYEMCASGYRQMMDAGPFVCTEGIVKPALSASLSLIPLSPTSLTIDLNRAISTSMRSAITSATTDTAAAARPSTELFKQPQTGCSYCSQSPVPIKHTPAGAATYSDGGKMASVYTEHVDLQSSRCGIQPKDEYYVALWTPYDPSKDSQDAPSNCGATMSFTNPVNGKTANGQVVDRCPSYVGTGRKTSDTTMPNKHVNGATVDMSPSLFSYLFDGSDQGVFDAEYEGPIHPGTDKTPAPFVVLTSDECG